MRTKQKTKRHEIWRLTLRKFLYTIVFLIVLVAAGLFALRVFGDELTEIALVPDTKFVEQDALELNAYQDPDMWFSRPGKGATNDPARWQPVFAADAAFAAGPDENATGAELSSDSSSSSRPAQTQTQAQTSGNTPAPQATNPQAPNVADTSPSAPAPGVAPPRFAVFFVHPTSFFERSSWNATLDDQESQARARLMVRGLASAFNQASEIWVPRYRQATFGAFITDAPEATQAIDSAYRDVEQAFDFFLDSIPADTPIVLAGHSQGAYHITRLLEERVAGTDLQPRIAMAYPIGWPISIRHDLPKLGLSACATPDQAACVFGYASFAEPADPGLFMRRYAAIPGLDGQPRGEDPILCVNPITGILNDDAPAELNTGTLVPNDNLTSGELVAGAIPARCDEFGLLLIGPPPAMGNQTFPGNNYHLVDIPLFWKNIQQDVVRRVGAWTPAQS